MSSGASESFLFVGSYAASGEAGIHTIRVDRKSGAMQLLHSVSGDINPSFVTLHPNGQYLYATNETDLTAGTPGGAVSAYAIDSDTGSLRWLGRQSTLSSGPCHLSIDHSARFVFVSNYKGGGLCVLPILDGGSLGPAIDYVQHHGTGYNPVRQDKPHVHSALPAPKGDYVLVADLGLDQVMIYPFDALTGKLISDTRANAVMVRSGAGPRHFTFSVDARFMYLINELDSTVDVWRYDADNVTCTLLQTMSTLPDDFSDESWCAQIRLHPNGRFLYGSNRGHDSLVTFGVDAQSGLLNTLRYTPSLGAWPRHFTLDSTGQFMAVANQKENLIVSFHINPLTGELTPTGHTLTVSKPTCVQILES